MNPALKWLTLLFYTLSSLAINAQIQRYPATVNPIVSVPHSLFLSDYTDPLKQQLIANILFHDFNETQWTFKLRIRLENADILIETHPNFTPSRPIEVSPGEPIMFTGVDWIEYLDYENLRIEGPGKSNLYSSGRLPEGLFTVTLQVLDYYTGEPLSMASQYSWWMGLFNPPILMYPEDRTYISESIGQINFLWQLFNTNSPNNQLGTNYQLTIWEITEENAESLDPRSVVQNGQGLQIFQSNLLSTPTFNYGPSEPGLEPGKAYVYRIQASDPDGKDTFQNDGYSEYRMFFYGWPTGGSIELKSPRNERTMTIRDQSSVQWHPPDNKLSIQPVSYEIRISEKDENESVSDALSSELWFYKEINPTSISSFLVSTIPPTTPTHTYAWEVIGYSGNQEVARSTQQTFFGPPLLERFYAGIHRIEVTSLNNDLDHLSGTGLVRLDTFNRWTEIEFKDLKVTQSGVIWVLSEGEILIEKEFEKVLRPQLRENGTANFVADLLRLNKEGLWARGRFTWRSHLASLSDPTGAVEIGTGHHWYNYDEYMPVGTAHIPGKTEYDLLDPYGFRLVIDTTSWISVNEDTYTMALDGDIVLPENVKPKAGSTRIELPFFQQEQLFYFKSSMAPLPNPIQATETLSLFIDPSSYLVDFSDDWSPEQFDENPGWKGVLFSEYELTIPRDFDPTGTILLDEPIHQIVESGSAQKKSNVASGGLNLSATVGFSSRPFVFSTFPSALDNIILEIEKSKVSDRSSIAGKTTIPILSLERPFKFRIPMSVLGIGSGYFEDIEGHEFEFNSENEQQRLKIKVSRAVLEQNERINMTLDIQWPALGLDLKGVKHFKVWGNYNIGFYTPEGVNALDRQIVTKYKGYSVTIDAISAGRNSGNYGFGVSGKISLGDDVSGDQGPPSFNMYSIAKNASLPGDYTPDTKMITGLGSDSKDLDEMVAGFEKEIRSEEENLVQSLKSLTDGMNLESELKRTREKLVGIHYSQQDMVVPYQGNDRLGFTWDDRSSTKEKLLIAAELIDVFVGRGTTSFVEQVDAMNDDELNRAYGATRNARDFVSKQAAKLAGNQASKLAKPLSNKVGEINQEISAWVDQSIAEVNSEIELAIGEIVANASEPILATVSEKAPDAVSHIQNLEVSIKETLFSEIEGSINQSAYQNIKMPITVLLEEHVVGRIDTYLRLTAEETVLAAMNSNDDPIESLGKRLNSIDKVIDSIGADVIGLIDPENLLNAVLALGSDAIGNIDPDRIIGKLEKAAIEAIAGYAKDKLANGVAELSNQALSEEIGIEIPLDVGMAAGKAIFSGGGVEDAFADPVPIRLRSPTVDLQGLVWLTEDHPIYGDVFSGSINAFIKVPDNRKPIEMNVAYMNGKSNEGFSYWFIEAGAGATGMKQPDHNSAKPPEGINEIGGNLSEEMDTPSRGINLGVMEVMALRGRVYKNMGGDPKGQLVPDKQTRFGAYLHLITFGPKNGERVRMEVEGIVNTFDNGNLIIDFTGNIQVDNSNPQILIPDRNASIRGEITIKYNRKEQHFFGYAGVELQSTGICGSGSLLVDVKPSRWRVALGSRDERLSLQPGCAGLRFMGWVDLNSDFVEVGVGLGVGVNKSFGFNAGVLKAGVDIDAAVDVLVFGSVNYSPLQVREIGVFVEAWAFVGVGYTLPAKSGYIELVDVYIYGASTVRFNPSPEILYGEIKGSVSVLRIFSFDFKKDYEVEI